MKKSQKNAIWEAIQKCNLDPQQFIFEEDEHLRIVSVRHRWSPSRCVVHIEARSYIVTWIVEDDQTRPVRMLTWWGVLRRVRRWLSEVKNDLETPDLWADLQRQAGLLQAASEDVTENTPFTPAEQEEIATRLSAWAEHAQRAHSLSSAQMQVLAQKLEYLIEAARRMGRKDWINVCAGTILGYILTTSLPPGSAREMFLGVLRAVGHLFGLPIFTVSFSLSHPICRGWIRKKRDNR
jgi:hypothetical protein